jgi:hypothetical protein
MSKTFQYPNGPLPWFASPQDFTGDYNLGIYAVETTPRYICGAKYETWDGREFRYCKSAAALVTHLGCQFTSAGVIAITTAVTTAAIGDTKVVVPTATHAALAKDELAGGFIFIYLDGPCATRGIIGNEASASAAAITVYLDGPLAIAVTTSSKFEIFHNPYKYMTQTGGAPDGFGWIGPPAAAVSASGMYFWAQRTGPVNMAPQSTITESNEAVGLAFRGDGSIEALATALGATIPGNDTSQYAGFRMGGSYTNNGPLICLTG